MVLIWLVGRQIIGRWAVLLAIVASMNPWFLRSQVNPIAETTMVFCILGGLYFIFRRSRWAYLFGCIGSMVRYECVALIFIAFLMDMVTCPTKKERLRAFGLSVLAAVPFLLWMLGTFVNWEHQQSHYLKNYGHGTVVAKFPEMMWQAAFMILFKLPAEAKAMVEPVRSQEAYNAIKSAVGSLTVFSQVVVSASLLASVVFGVIKRNWNVLSLWVFVILYSIIHAFRVSTHHRYCVPVSWMLVLLVWFGFQSLWRLIAGEDRIPVFVKNLLAGLIAVAGIFWAAKLISPMIELGPRCVKGKPLPWAGIISAGAIVGLYLGLFRVKCAPKTIALWVVVCLMILSQHFMVIQIIDNGAYYAEFKHFLDWYKENSEPGEKIATRWSSTLRYMSDSRRKDLIGLKTVAGDSFESFIQNCYEKNISYVAYSPRGSASTRRGVEHLIEPLTNKDSEVWVGPLRMVQKINVGRRWVNVYRLTEGRGPVRTKPKVSN